MAETNYLVLVKHLRSIDARLDGMARDIAEIKGTQSGIILHILAAHDARLSRIEERLDRIERRLDLTETPAAG
jgi:hypothetical protein